MTGCNIGTACRTVHQGGYDESLRADLPLIEGVGPVRLVEIIEAAGWKRPRLERLRDVEWATSLRQPPLVRLLGVTPEFAVTAE